MVQPSKNAAAQYLYLAQLYAQKGACKCKSCELLRRCSDAMIDQALQPAGTGAQGVPAGVAEAINGAAASVNLESEEAT